MAKKRRGNDINGILVLDKASGESSNRCLQQVKRLFNAAKAGHTGSLDPLATGVLPLCFGEATKVSQFLLDSDKAYQVTIRLGVRTDTGDSEGNVLSEQAVPVLERAMLEQVLGNFRGEIEQLPPMYSALKHQGTPLYKLARQGKSIERESRRVRIHRLELLAMEGADIRLEIHCSKGTYIRSIADDLGELLACGAHVRALRRIKAGPFGLESSFTFSDLEKILAEQGEAALLACLVPADQAVSTLPAVVMPAATAMFVRQGQAVIVRNLPTEGLVRLYDGEVFFGIGEILEDGKVAPRRLFFS